MASFTQITRPLYRFYWETISSCGLSSLILVINWLQILKSIQRKMPLSSWGNYHFEGVSIMQISSRPNLFFKGITIDGQQPSFVKPEDSHTYVVDGKKYRVWDAELKRLERINLAYNNATLVKHERSNGDEWLPSNNRKVIKDATDQDRQAKRDLAKLAPKM